MEVILVKFVTLNYPRLEINSKLREKIKWTFPWVKHNSKVVLDGPTSRFVYRIYDPENELQDLFDEVAMKWAKVVFSKERVFVILGQFKLRLN